MKGKTVTVPVIESRQDLKAALERLNEIFMVDSNSELAHERTALSLIIEDFERRLYPIFPPSPRYAILFAIEQRSFPKHELALALGGAPRLSEILNGRRTPSLAQIRVLHDRFGIPYESLIPGTKCA